MSVTVPGAPPSGAGADGDQDRTPTRVWVEHHMGMPVSLHVRGADLHRPEIDRAVTAAYQELARTDEIFSTWIHDSQVSRLRRGELVLAQCDPWVAEAAAIGERARDATAGAFSTRLPDADGVCRFDPTGLVKGWAVQRAATQLAGIPGLSWCLNAGGDLVAGRHAHVPPSGAAARPWRIGIEDPHDRCRIAQVLWLVEGGVATSGTAARGAHLVDPRTNRHVRRVGSTTVVGPDLLWADIWATALFVGDAQTREAFARHRAYQVIDL